MVGNDGIEPSSSQCQCEILASVLIALKNGVDNQICTGPKTFTESRASTTLYPPYETKMWGDRRELNPRIRCHKPTLYH